MSDIRFSFDDEDLLCPCQPEDPAFVRPIHTLAACKRWRAGGAFVPWGPEPTSRDHAATPPQSDKCA